jgi:hypothetical protein
MIGIRGVFSTNKVALKQWNLIIYKETGNRTTIVRLFSGGSIPPSSILWNARNAGGDLVEKGTYKIRLILIDTFNREVSSSVIEVRLQ